MHSLLFSLFFFFTTLKPSSLLMYHFILLIQNLLHWLFSLSMILLYLRNWIITHMPYPLEGRILQSEHPILIGPPLHYLFLGFTIFPFMMVETYASWKLLLPVIYQVNFRFVEERVTVLMDEKPNNYNRWILLLAQYFLLDYASNHWQIICISHMLLVNGISGVVDTWLPRVLFNFFIYVS
jgi:hypothetical protein